MTPPIEERLSPEKKSLGSLESQLDKSTASEPEVARDIPPAQKSPIKTNMMMPNDLQNELARKLNNRSKEEQVISSSSLKSNDQKLGLKANEEAKVPGKLDRSKTDKIKIEMRLPGMVPGGKMALPGLTGGWFLSQRLKLTFFRVKNEVEIVG